MALETYVNAQIDSFSKNTDFDELKEKYNIKASSMDWVGLKEKVKKIMPSLKKENNELVFTKKYQYLSQIVDLIDSRNDIVHLKIKHTHNPTNYKEQLWSKLFPRKIRNKADKLKPPYNYYNIVAKYIEDMDKQKSNRTY